MQAIGPGENGLVPQPGTPPALLSHAIPFDPEDRHAALSQVPEGCGVFALFAEDPAAEPYLAKASHLRRRLQRFLSPAPSQSRRLQLAARIRRIEYTETGSDFASDLVYYQAAKAIDRLPGKAVGHASARDARTRLRLRPPAFLKLRMENPYPRAVITTSFSRSAIKVLENEPIGPFPSKAFAERYLEQVLDLFLLRRCTENLDPNPAHPGCVYSEMKKCLAPCYQGCTDERYAEEATAVRDFLRTRGQSLLGQIAQERESAAEALAFESAASLHQRYEKTEAVASQMPDAARPLSQLSGIIIQPGSSPEQVDLFAITRGQLTGPVLYSTLGMRLHNELSGSSSLFTQPMALEAVPLAEDGSPVAKTESKEAYKDMLEARLDDALLALQPQRSSDISTAFSDHLSLFARWYYRPATRRIGEIIFVDDQGNPPRRAILRAISRVAAIAQFGAGAPGAKPSKWHA